MIPSLREWHQEFSPQGLVLIGNHYPEFGYPVTQDNEGATWRAYNNRYWPTLYLIDKRGEIRYKHIGEGAYQETEAAIQALLAEPYP